MRVPVPRPKKPAPCLLHSISWCSTNWRGSGSTSTECHAAAPRTSHAHLEIYESPKRPWCGASSPERAAETTIREDLLPPTRRTTRPCRLADRQLGRGSVNPTPTHALAPWQRGTDENTVSVVPQPAEVRFGRLVPVAEGGSRECWPSLVACLSRWTRALVLPAPVWPTRLGLSGVCRPRA